MLTTERPASPAAALRDRLLRSRTEHEIETGFTSPLAVAGREGLPLHRWTATAPLPAAEPVRACSRGCHALPAGAKFDPHTGEPLHGRAAAPRRAKKLVLRAV